MINLAKYTIQIISKYEKSKLKRNVSKIRDWTLCFSSNNL